MSTRETDSFPKISDQEDESKKVPQLIDVFRTATFSPNRAIGHDITRIALGAFEKEADDLMRQTEEDPEQKEKGRDVYAFPDGRILIKKTDALSGEGFVMSRQKIHRFSHDPRIPKILRQDKFSVTLMHTHATPSIPSGIDIHYILIEDTDPAAMTTAFVINPLERIIIFRGQQTPMFKTHEALIKMAKLDKAILRRFDKFIASEMDSEEREKLMRRIDFAMLRDITRFYDLRVFIAPRGDSIARLYTPDQLNPRTWNK